MSTRLALGDQWLNQSTTLTNASYNVGGSYNAGSITNGWWPYDQTYHYYNWYPYFQPLTITEPARPIKLKFTEVEKLRAAAAKDKALKAILEKFTPQIEVEVDL